MQGVHSMSYRKPIEDNVQFLKTIEERARIGNILHSKNDTLRLHELADEPVHDPLIRDYYRMPVEYVCRLARKGVLLEQGRALANNYHCTVLKQKKHLVLLGCS